MHRPIASRAVLLALLVPVMALAGCRDDVVDAPLGAVEGRSDALGQALWLRGLASSATIDSRHLASDKLTVELWFRTFGDGVVIQKTDAWIFMIDDGYLTMFSPHTDTRVVFDDADAPQPADGDWHHLAFTVDEAGALSVVYDGVFYGTKAFQKLNSISGRGDWRFRPRHDAEFDELRIWGAVLHPDDIRKRINEEIEHLDGLLAYWRFNGNLLDQTGVTGMGVLGDWEFSTGAKK